MGAAHRGFNAGKSFHPMFRNVPGVKTVSALIALTAATALGACVPTISDRGDLPGRDHLAEIHPGSTTKTQVEKILGTPSSISVFDDNAWYYVSRKTKQIAFFQPKVLDQDVYVVDFNNSGVVTHVGHLTEANAESVEPAPGATPAPGRKLTFLEQIIGNIGRFNGGTGEAPESTGRNGARPNGPVPNASPGEPTPQD